MISAAYQRQDFPPNHPWFLRLLGDTNPVSDSVEAEQRLRAILSEPRIDEASQLRFETANLVAIYLYWFGIEFPQDRPHAVAWALVRSGGSKIEPLAEALFSTLSWEDKSLAETLFMQLDLVLPGGAPRWHPPTLMDYINF